jgi:hypothetical protein
MVHGPPCQSAPTPHRVPRGEVAVTFARSKRLLCDRSWCVCLSSCDEKKGANDDELGGMGSF